MAKIIVDVTATCGDKFILLGVQPLDEYQDNKKTGNIIGSKLTVISLANYERYIVKVPQLVHELMLDEKDEITFNNLEGNVYVANGRVALSLKAGSAELSKFTK